MPFDMQVKLLRVLQSGEIQRVGGLRTVPVDLRIISATNKDLKEAIAQHQFRADLYYRISTLSILVPPLRERAEDILPLAEHFIHRHELRLNRHPVPLPQETAEAILRYPVARQYPAVGERRGAGGASGGRRRVVARAFWDCGSHGEPQARRARPGAGDA